MSDMKLGIPVGYLEADGQFSLGTPHDSGQGGYVLDDKAYIGKRVYCDGGFFTEDTAIATNNGDGSVTIDEFPTMFVRREGDSAKIYSGDGNDTFDDGNTLIATAQVRGERVVFYNAYDEALDGLSLWRATDQIVSSHGRIRNLKGVQRVVAGASSSLFDLLCEQQAKKPRAVKPIDEPTRAALSEIENAIQAINVEQKEKKRGQHWMATHRYRDLIVTRGPKDGHPQNLKNKRLEIEEKFESWEVRADGRRWTIPYTAQTELARVLRTLDGDFPSVNVFARLIEHRSA